MRDPTKLSDPTLYYYDATFISTARADIIYLQTFSDFWCEIVNIFVIALRVRVLKSKAEYVYPIDRPSMMGLVVTCYSCDLVVMELYFT